MFIADIHTDDPALQEDNERLNDDRYR